MLSGATFFFSFLTSQEITFITPGCHTQVLFGETLHMRANFESHRLQNNQKLVCFVLLDQSKWLCSFLFFSVVCLIHTLPEQMTLNFWLHLSPEAKWYVFQGKSRLVGGLSWREVTAHPSPHSSAPLYPLVTCALSVEQDMIWQSTSWGMRTV